MCSFKWKGEFVVSAENAYQSEKTHDQSYKRRILKAVTPIVAKRLGRRAKLRGDWDNVKLEIMLEVVREKFEQIPRLAEELMKTAGHNLIEGNDWGDDFWGMIKVNGEWKGENHLGKILMVVRNELILSK